MNLIFCSAGSTLQANSTASRDKYCSTYQIRHYKLGERIGKNISKRQNEKVWSLKHQLDHLTDRWELFVTKCPFSSISNVVDITSRNGCLGIYLMDYFLLSILLSSLEFILISMLKPKHYHTVRHVFFLMDSQLKRSVLGVGRCECLHLFVSETVTESTLHAQEISSDNVGLKGN